MNRSSIKEELERIILRVVVSNRDFIEEEEKLTSLGLDSIGLLTVICIIEDKLGVVISEQDIFQITCFHDFIEVVSQGLKCQK